MSALQNVLLIGASGALGSVVLQAFLKSKYTVTILSRQSSTSTFPSSVRVVKADYDSLSSLTAAMQGQDVVISMVGGAVVGDQGPLIDAAAAAGVKKFFPSEYGPDTLNPGVHEIIPTLPAKVEAVEHLRAKEPQMGWTSIITGGWLDWGLKGGIYPFDFESRTASLVDDGVTTFTATTLQKVAKALLASIEHTELTRNKYVYVYSFNISQNELLSALEKVDGQKWAVKQENSDDIIEEGRRVVRAGDYSGTANLVKGLMFGKSGLGASRPADGFWNERLGLEEEDLEQTLRDIMVEIK